VLAGQDRRPRRLDAIAALILLAWATVIAPRLIQSLLASKYRTDVDVALPFPALALLAERALELAVIGCCLVILIRRLKVLPGDRRLLLALLIAPWLYMLFRDMYLDTKPQIATFLWPFLILAIWALRPPMQRLALLGWLVGLTSVLSVGMAIVMPDKGIFSAVGGALIAPDKQILPWGILIGPFTDGNNLGQFLALGLPAIGLIKMPAWRFLLATVTMFAVVFSSSRSSLAAIAASALVALVLVMTPKSLRGVVAGTLMLVAAATTVLLPLTTHSDQAFTNRGFIWRVSLQMWHGDPFVGLGSNYYDTIGQYANALGGNAFHGHNQFVQTLITGGVAYLLLTASMLLALGVAAARLAAQERSFGAVYLVAFFVSCTVEVSFGIVDRGFLFAVTALPMAFIAFSEDRPGPLRPFRKRTPIDQAARTTPSSRASAARRVSSSWDSSTWDMRLPSATTSTPSASRDSASASATRRTGGAFNSTRP
jgi:hypothetical protein